MRYSKLSSKSTPCSMSGTKTVDTSGDQGPRLFSCDICGVTVSSEAVLNAHLRGRPHQFNLDKRRSAERSIYVRGFPMHSVMKEDLQKLFEPFGKVKSIWLPGSYVFAIVEFAEEKSAERVLHAREPLLINGKRLIVKPRDIKVPRNSKSKEHHHGDSAMQSDEDHRTPRNHRGRRFKGHHDRGSGGGYFEEPQFKFDPEVQRKLAAVNSAEEQLKLISSYYKMPMSAIRAHLSICSALTKELQSKFPSGLVVPFGAAISGHGTLTSDCDICLFTQLSEQEKALFTPPNYQPRDLKPSDTLAPPPNTTQAASVLASTSIATTTALLTSSPATIPPLTSSGRVSCSPIEDEIQSSSSEASSPADSPRTPKNEASSTRSSGHFDVVASTIRGMAECSKILPIPHARCPIVRFVYEPANIHCDLSIDNVLGPANTRLMQAYSQFDERFALLVLFVRLWVKHNGPPRTQLNSYAVSLMLIYCLQRCTPPVLPCLQDPGTWPKNMDWFSKHGFELQQRPKLRVGPWSCDFVPPDSLLPSANTQTPVELLLHFFKFYSGWKSSEEIVAIHCPLDKTLSPSAAKALATAPQEQGYKVRPFRNFASFIIQDPFEFDHNLCKALSKPNFTAFIHHLKIAAELLASTNNLLLLFDRKEYQKVEVQLYAKPRRLIFNTYDLKDLFRGNPTFSVLGEGLEKLDMNDSFIHQSVSLVALKAITEYLQCSLSFTCSPDNSTGAENSSQEDDYHNDEDGDTNDSAEANSEPPENTAVSANCQPDVDTIPSSECIDMDKDIKHPAGAVKNPEPSSTCKTKEVANGETSLQCVDETGRRKRAHANSDDEQHDEKKRTKKGNSQSTDTLDILRQLQQKCQSAKYVCTAVSDTWTHRRQRRRKLEQQKEREGEEEKMDTSELTESLPSLPALLCMKLFTDSSKAPLVTIKVDQLPPLNMNKFNNWFTLVNKELHRHPHTRNSSLEKQ